VRFASVYRSFQDVSEFTDMIEHLQTTATDGGSVASGTEPMRPTATDGGSVETDMESVRQK